MIARVDRPRAALWAGAWTAVLLVTFLSTVVHAQQGTVAGLVVDVDSGEPLNYSNVVILGSTMGGNAINGGQFQIQRVPTGVCQVQAS